MPPLRMRITCSPRPRASITFDHSLRAVWLGSLFIANRIDRPFPDRDGDDARVLAGVGRTELAREPLRDVLGRRIDRVERSDIVDAAVVELLRERLELPLCADEIDRDGVLIDAAATRGQLRLDLVRVSVQ